MRITLALALAFCAAPAWPQTASTPSTIHLSGTDATVTSFAGVTRDASAAIGLFDRDAIATGLNGSAKVVSSTGWTAMLGPSTAAALRTEPISGGVSPVFARVLDLSGGSIRWTVAKGATGWLRTPAGLLKAAASTVTVSFADGVLSIQSEDGEVQLTGNTADVKLKAGQWLRVHFSIINVLFTFEVIEDNGNPIDIVVGLTIVHATKGDLFEIQIINLHADVRVTKGLIQVSGPDKRVEEVGPGFTITVINGGTGAVRGEGPKLLKKGPGIPVLQIRDAYGNHTYIFFTRQDISPS